MGKQNIVIVSFSIGRAGLIPLSNFIDIFNAISNDLYLVCSYAEFTSFLPDSRVNSYGFIHKRGSNWFTRILNFIYSQFKISYILVKLHKKIDILVFTIGADGLILPMITAKLFRKKVVLAFAGSTVKTLKSANDKFFKIYNVVSKLTILLSNRIIVYSPNNIHEFGLDRYKYKIDTASRHFLDFGEFKLNKKFDERDQLVGYIGRFSVEKGILNLVKAIPIVLAKINVKFLLIGDGQLRKDIEDYIRFQKLESNVQITGWVNHDDLPDYLNDMKLVVLPSYTEGLPNIMLEAMACGTPVLATPVGSIPNIIKDEETGFIMENNSPHCIAENLIRVLEYPDLMNIVKNARAFVEKDFTYEAAVERYSSILKKI